MLPSFEVFENEEKRNRLLILYKCFREPLYELAYLKVKSVEKAEDFVHDTFVKLIDNLDRIDSDAYTYLNHYLKEKERQPKLTLKQYAKAKNDTTYSRAWYYVFIIMNNLINDMYRKQKSNKVTTVEEYFDNAVASEKENPLIVLQKREQKTILKDALINMKSPYKEVIYLKYFKKLSTQEIGVMLDKSNDNIRQILKRARDMLKVKLQEGGYDGKQ